MTRLIEYRDFYLADWCELPIPAVTDEMAIAKHKQITKENGPGRSSPTRQSRRSDAAAAGRKFRKQHVKLSGDCPTDGSSSIHSIHGRTGWPCSPWTSGTGAQ